MGKARDIASAAPAPAGVTSTELGYVDGVTSAIQTQINTKQAVVSGVDDTEIGYLNGVTSAIQTQIDNKIGQSTAINPTIVDAKGDIIAATAADTVARLAVGANNTVLTADSSTATGLKWATPAAGGMTLISTTTLSGNITNISSIPSGYKSLFLRVLGAYGTNLGDLSFRFNNDSGNPSYVSTTSSYSSSLSISGLGGTWMFGGYCFNGSIGQYNIVELYIPNYSSTVEKKPCYTYNATRSDSSQNISLGFRNNYWDNNSAITQINIGGFTNFAAGTALLYGVN